MLTASRIEELLKALNDELAIRQIRGELYLAGGAVMCLVFRARDATKDIDRLLIPAPALREAAAAVAAREGLPPGWINDAVKGFFSAAGRFDVYADLGNLKVFSPHPDYLLAMKCLAMRLGEEYQDRQDAALLLRIAGVQTISDAESVLLRYYPLERYPAKSRFVLEELLPGPDTKG